MNVGTAALRNRLSFYLNKVRGGQRVVVMDRGRPVAQLVPYAAAADDLAARIVEMTAEGLLTRQAVRRRAPVTPVTLHKTDRKASTLVSQMRDEE